MKTSSYHGFTLDCCISYSEKEFLTEFFTQLYMKNSGNICFRVTQIKICVLKQPILRKVVISDKLSEKYG